MNIQAWKIYEDSNLIACDLDDPDAIKFCIRYPNTFQSTLDFETLRDAEKTCRVLNRMFGLGVEAGKKQVRTALGL